MRSTFKEHIVNKHCLDHYRHFWTVKENRESRVFFAINKETSTNVAIKQTFACALKEIDTETIKNLIKEIEILQILNTHQNLCKLLEIYEDKNGVFLVFEYIKGVMLDELYK